MNHIIRFTTGLLLTVALTFLSGCDDEFPDYYNEKEFEFEGFEGVKLGEAFQIEITESPDFSVIAKGENNDLNDLQMEVLDGALVVNYKPGTRNHKRTLLQISMPNLVHADLHSASSSRIAGFEDAENNLVLKVSGASRVVTDTDWNLLDIQVDGASELIFKGSAELLKAKIRGASRLQAAELTVASAIVEVGGSSEASVNASQNLSGEVDGHSLLRYTGNPAAIDVEVATDSQIIQL